MADSSCSSDLEPEASRPRKHSKGSKKATGKRPEASSHPSCRDKLIPGMDRDTLRHHNALARQCAKAQKAAALSASIVASQLPGAPWSERRS